MEVGVLAGLPDVGPTVGVGGRESSAVGGEGQAEDLAAMAEQGEHLLAIRGVPEPDLGVAADGSEADLADAPVGDPQHVAGVLGEHAQGAARDGSQRRIVPSAPAVARERPSGWKARPLIIDEWADQSRIGANVAASQRRTQPSPPAEASALPSGAKATPKAARMAREDCQRTAVGRPEPDRAVANGRRDRLAVGAVSDAVDRAAEPGEQLEQAAGRGVPEADRPVLPGRGERLAVGAKATEVAPRA